jgi:hypothetical protein
MQFHPEHRSVIPNRFPSPASAQCSRNPVAPGGGMPSCDGGPSDDDVIPQVVTRLVLPITVPLVLDDGPA